MGYAYTKHTFSRMAAPLILVGLVTACRPVPKAAGMAASPDDIREVLAHAIAPLTLVHIWATWCDPCREEFPDILEVYRATQGQGLALQLVSADDPKDMEAVDRFLQEQNSPVGSLVATELNQAFVELFSTNWSGALPASFFFDSNGKLVAAWEGKHSYKEYRDTIEQLLNP